MTKCEVEGCDREGIERTVKRFGISHVFCDVCCRAYSIGQMDWITLVEGEE